MTVDGNVRRPVLVIDEAADVRAMLATILDHAGYRALVVADGESGLTLLARERPALVVVDYQLTGLFGPQIVRSTRANPATSTVPIIVLTAASTDHQIDEAFAAGADDYIVKPVDRRLILARIESAIRAADDRQRAAALQAAAKERDALLSDLAHARRIQETQSTALPRSLRAATAMGATVACAHIGGDLIAAFDGRDGSTTGLLIDVSGHGAGAALTAASVLADIRGLVQRMPLVEAFATLNRQMTASRNRLYACIGAVQISGRTATVLNAGLPPISLVRQRRVAVAFTANGVPPGLLPNATYEARTVELELDDRFVFVSDGLTEPFGEADDVTACLRTLELFVPNGIRTSSELTREIRALANNEPLRDDAALLVLDFVEA
jgi:sigma-B regulation protein RsbU (phosphoserine phosphatase)